jgi:hypothetical protein
LERLVKTGESRTEICLEWMERDRIVLKSQEHFDFFETKVGLKEEPKRKERA